MTNQEIEKMLQEYYSDKRIVSLSFEYYEKTERDIFVYELEINKPLILLDNALVQTFTMFEKRDDNYFFRFITDRKQMAESFENIKESKELYK